MTPSQPVIEPSLLRPVASTGDEGASVVRLLHYNESVADFLREVPAERRRSVLRRMEREVAKWRAQQTSEQSAWVRKWADSPYRGPIAAAASIVEYLG